MTDTETMNEPETRRQTQPFVPLPSPFYDRDGITIYNTDCRDILQQLGDFDLLLTDPPYGIGYVKGKGGKGIHCKNRRNIDAVVGDDQPFDPQPFMEFKNAILWGANHYAARLPHGRWIAWNKLGDKEPWDSFSDVEFAWQNGRGKDRIVSHLWKGLCQAGAGEKRWHPTQKPLGVMKWCIGLVPDAKTVLDPFMGSGTTLVAAKLLGLRAVGIEINADYCAVAVERLRQGVLDFGED